MMVWPSSSQLEIRRLDDYGIQNVGLIKIDTQGSEYDILLGGRETLLNNDCVQRVERGALLKCPTENAI